MKEERNTKLFRQNVIWTVQKTYKYSMHVLQEFHLVNHKQAHNIILICAHQNVIWLDKKTYNYSIDVLQEVHLVSHKQHCLILEYALQTFLQTQRLVLEYSLGTIIKHWPYWTCLEELFFVITNSKSNKKIALGN